MYFIIIYSFLSSVFLLLISLELLLYLYIYVSLICLKRGLNFENKLCHCHCHCHTWKLANIVPIPKPNKYTNKGTSYRAISLLSVIANTPEKSLLPYITANIPNRAMQHGYKTQHSTVTELHTLNNTIENGFNQMAPLREQSL